MWEFSVVLYLTLGFITSLVHYKNLHKEEYDEEIEDLPYYDRRCIKGYIPVYLLVLMIFFPLLWMKYLKKHLKERKGI